MLFGKKVTIIVGYIIPTGAIGRNNKLLVKCAEDMRHFKETTTYTSTKRQNAVIIGRRTFESIGKPLKDRLNIIFSSQKIDKYNEGYVSVTSLTEFENFIEKISDTIENIFIIGGSCVYNMFLSCSYVDSVIATEFYVRDDAKADAYFDINRLKEFRLVSILPLTNYAMVKTYNRN